jgi:TonB family protein
MLKSWQICRKVKLTKSKAFEKERPMKVCPQCHSEFEDVYNYCLKDGTPLANPAGTETTEPETLVRTDPPNFGEETIPIIPGETGLGEKTEVLDSPFGEETSAIDPPPVTAGDSHPEETGQNFADPPTEEWAGGTPSEQWRQQPEYEGYEDYVEEPEEENRTYAAAAVPVEQTEPAEDFNRVPPEKSRSHLGLIIGLLALFGILILGAAGGGVYFFLKSRQPAGEIGAANTNAENETTAENSGGENTAADLPAGNTENGEEPADSENTEPGTTPTPIKDDEEKKQTPTPRPTPSPKDSRQTPTPNRIPADDDDPPPPPPPKPPPVPKRISGGVVNGKAISLPVPAYPPAARAANIRGSVNVAVVIGKNGSVMSASAVSGHPLLRSAAVSAARRARFAPTVLSGQPVEVSGVIVYNFQ